MYRQNSYEASNIGYKHMRMDTVPFMDKAIEMYEKEDFYKIDNYNNRAQSAIFMSLDIL